MAHENYLKIVFMAALADGKLQQQEIDMLNNFRKQHPIMKKFSETAAQNALEDVNNKVSANIEIKYILDEIAESFTEEQKHAAYALAKEVCSADFNILPFETDFLNQLEIRWKIPKNVIASVDLSLKLRYFT